ncbi:hypothetical protein [Vagococcus carniphilus]|uniref:hypothetical protein n=1 Tax=Vagococcus carniphilus TaxID=218144 RepID=UPI003BAA8653
MISDIRKKDKYVYDIIWSIVTAIVACVMVYFNYTADFWTYSMVLYAIPVLVNIAFFIGIYDCFQNKKDFDEKFKKHFAVTEEHFLKEYYKNFKISIIIIKVLICLLIFSIIGLLAISFTFPNLINNSEFRLYSYGFYYFLFLVGALTEKKLTKSFNMRVDKDYFRKEGLKND